MSGPSEYLQQNARQPSPVLSISLAAPGAPSCRSWESPPPMGPPLRSQSQWITGMARGPRVLPCYKLGTVQSSKDVVSTTPTLELCHQNMPCLEIAPLHPRRTATQLDLWGAAIKGSSSLEGSGWSEPTHMGTVLMSEEAGAPPGSPLLEN